MIVNASTGVAGSTGIYMLSRQDGFLGDLCGRLCAFFVPCESVGKTVLYGTAALALFLFGSILPDIDSKKSMLGRYVHLPVKHRTITHTIWVVALLGIPAIKFRVFVWLALGYMLHIFYDGLSSAGIAWFWPISRYITYPSGAVIKKGFRFKFYHTGDASEAVVVIAVCCLCAFVAITSLLRIVGLWT